MFRIDDPTASITLPSPSTPGIPGYFTSGNPAIGSPATIVTQDWANEVQEELYAFITAAGYTPSKTNLAQVSQAVQSGSLNYAADSSGTPNTVTVTLAPAPPAYKNGLSILVTIANTNTGPTNVNVNALGNVPVYFKGSALVGQEMHQGQLAQLAYIGGVFQLLSVFAAPTTIFVGTTTTGSANAQVTSTTPSSYTLVIGNIVTFEAGFTNTGAMTLNAESTGAIAVKKVSGLGLVDLVAGDIVNGGSYQVEYNGTFYQLLSSSLTPSSFFQVSNNLSEGVPATMRTTIGAFGKIVYQKFTASGTYTPSANMIYAIVRMVAGGAGGNSNGGGGSGEYAEGLFTAATIGSSKAITIGALGAVGSPGGTTSIGSLMTAIGGNPCTNAIGMLDSVGSSGGDGGSGGSGGDFRFRGGNGHQGIVAAYNFAFGFGGDGGDSAFGAGGQGSLGQVGVTATVNAQPADGYGAGGGGSMGNGNSTAGTAGYVVIQEFCSA